MSTIISNNRVWSPEPIPPFTVDGLVDDIADRFRALLPSQQTWTAELVTALFTGIDFWDWGFETHIATALHLDTDPEGARDAIIDVLAPRVQHVLTGKTP